MPFEKRALVLAKFGYLDFEAQKVTERGRWLADLHVDRPLLVGEALERGLFGTIDSERLSAVIAALTADEDRDYGELELDDALVKTLGQFEEIGFGVATEEWEHGIEPAPELNFSAAGRRSLGGRRRMDNAGAEDACGRGRSFSLLSRTGRRCCKSPDAQNSFAGAQIAWAAAQSVLREPVR